MKKIFRVCILAALLAGCAVQEDGAVKKPRWEENKFDVEIYTGEFDGVYEEQHLSRETNQSEGRHGKCSGDTAWLLVVDGGFVPMPDIHTVRGETPYAPLESLAPMGIEAEYGRDEYGYYVLLRRGEDTLRLTGQWRAEKNGEQFETKEFLMEEMDEKMYVPICFVAEQFDGTVQVIRDFRKEICGDDYGYEMKVGMVAVEMPGAGQTAFTPEEGLAEVMELSMEEHRQCVESAEECGRPAPAYDPTVIHYTGEDLGRYYVYTLEGFETLPIFANRYTGEVYGAQPGLPIVWIDDYFPNISWLL